MSRYITNNKGADQAARMQAEQQTPKDRFSSLEAHIVSGIQCDIMYPFNYYWRISEIRI